MNISFRLPQADRTALADHLLPLIRAAIIAGGDKVHIGMQPYDPEDEED